MVAAYPTAIEAGRQALRQNAGAATPSGCKIKTYNALYKFMACQKVVRGGGRAQRGAAGGAHQSPNRHAPSPTPAPHPPSQSMGGGKRYQFVYRIKFNCSGATKERTFFTQVAYKGGSYKAEKWAPM